MPTGGKTTYPKAKIMRITNLVWLPLVLSVAACGAIPMPTLLTKIMAPVPALSVAEGELYRCAAPPMLAADAEEYEDVLGTALSLRASLDDCRERNDKLIGVATMQPPKPAAAVPAKTATK